MSKKSANKMVLLYILEILKKHSDEFHTLNQQDIIKYLKTEYLMDADRKTVLRNLNDLIDGEYDIVYEEKDRGKGKSKSTVRTNFFYNPDFEESELRLIIDGLLFSKYIPARQRKKLIQKVESLSSENFKSRVKYITLLPDDDSTNKQLFYNIGYIDEAISKGKKIKFNYISYDINKKPYCRKNADGTDKEYVVTALQMVATMGRYYLICNNEKFDGIGNYRIDRMMNVEVTKEPAKSKEEIEKFNKGFTLPKHMMEHIYMMGGESDLVTFEFDKNRINDVLDWFGQDITFRDLKNGKIEARTHVVLTAMKYWALQYLESVVVKSPKKLVDDIKNTLKNNIKNYK